MFSVRFQSCKLPWRSARVPQYLFPRSVDGDGGGTVKKGSKKGSKQLGITIRGKTRCVLLHFDSSKRCVYPLYKFLYAFKVINLFLKHPV
jgi:hypothetical protein